MTHPTRLALITLTLTTGCVLYDGECKDEFWADTGWEDDGWGDEDTDPGSDDVAPTLGFQLTPAEGLAGSTFITSLEADEDVPFEEVSDVWFFGEVSLCTKAARSDELILTLSIDRDAELGKVDMVVEMANGERHLVPDALDILGEDGQGLEGDDGGGDGDDGGGDGDDGDGGSGDDGGSNPCG